MLELTSNEQDVCRKSFVEDFPLSCCVYDAMTRALRGRDLVKEMGGLGCVLAAGGELYRHAVEMVEELAVLDALRKIAEEKAQAAKAKLCLFSAEVGTDVTGTHIGEGSGPSPTSMEPPASRGVSRIAVERRPSVDEWAHEVRCAVTRKSEPSLDLCETITSMRDLIEAKGDHLHEFHLDAIPSSLETIQPLINKARAAVEGNVSSCIIA